MQILYLLVFASGPSVSVGGKECLFCLWLMALCTQSQPKACLLYMHEA